MSATNNDSKANINRLRGNADGTAYTANGSTAGSAAGAQAGGTGIISSIRSKAANYQEDTIDLLALLREFRKHIIAILLCVIIGGGAAGAFSKYVMIPQYSSSSMMYILSKETTLTSLADLQIGSQLTNDYQVIVKSRPVLQAVIDQLNLDLTYEQFSSRISISNPQNTRILTITTQDADPVLAKDIVDSVARVASDYIAETMEMVPPKMIEEGTVATTKSSPSVSKNALLGALVGAVIMCGIITVRFIMNDTVTTTEDVENYLGLPVLASIPERKYASKEADDKAAGSKKKSRKRK